MSVRAGQIGGADSLANGSSSRDEVKVSRFAYGRQAVLFSDRCEPWNHTLDNASEEAAVRPHLHPSPKFLSDRTCASRVHPHIPCRSAPTLSSPPASTGDVLTLCVSVGETDIEKDCRSVTKQVAARSHIAFKVK